MKEVVTRNEWFSRMNKSGAQYDENGRRGPVLIGYVVFSNENVEKGIWRKYPGTADGSWPLEERTYEVYANNKYFIPSMGGSSIFASNLSSSDYCKLSDCWFGDRWITEEFYFDTEDLYSKN